MALSACRFNFDFVDGDGGEESRDGALGDVALADNCATAHPAARFCDSFESPNMRDAWDYNVVLNGRAERVTARAHRGLASLEVATFDVPDLKYARWGTFVGPAITGGDLYVRAFYWLDSATNVDDQLSLIVTGNSADPYPSTNILLTEDSVNIGTHTDNFTFVQTFPRDRWTCIELHIFVEPTVGFVDLTFDGGTPLQTTPTDTAVAGGYTYVDAGIHYATAAQSAAAGWVDDIVFDTQPIGCN